LTTVCKLYACKKQQEGSKNPSLSADVGVRKVDLGFGNKGKLSYKKLNPSGMPEAGTTRAYKINMP
jgi:hypothetical protein